MDFEFHHIQQKEGYAIVQIDNPPANALSDNVKNELYDVLGTLKSNNRAIILTGTGEKTFIAGADIRELGRLDEGGGITRVSKSRKLFSFIENYPIPVIAAINASALGGGLEIALCCDICISAKEAMFGLPEVNLGVIPGGGGTQRLTRSVSPGMAKLMIYSGKIISAEEALHLGIVQVVVEREKLLDEAEKIAGKIIQKAPLAVQYSKLAINYGLQIGLEGGLTREIELFGKLCGTTDKNEGVNAFLEKRKPSFIGE